MKEKIKSYQARNPSNNPNDNQFSLTNLYNSLGNIRLHSQDEQHDISHSQVTK